MSGWAAGWAEQAAPGLQAAKGLEAGQSHSAIFPFGLSLCGRRERREWDGGKVFKEVPGEKKAETPSPWISNCLSREVSLRALLGFREKITRAEAGLGSGGRGQRAQL